MCDHLVFIISFFSGTSYSGNIVLCICQNEMKWNDEEMEWNRIE